MLEKELELKIMKRLGRTFKETFNEEAPLHSTRNKAEEVHPMPESSSSSMADML